MRNGEDWLLRPVLAGMCSYESLLNGAVDLQDVAIMNHALDVQQENDERLHRAVRAMEGGT